MADAAIIVPAVMLTIIVLAAVLVMPAKTLLYVHVSSCKWRLEDSHLVEGDNVAIRAGGDNGADRSG
jgi:hypothetical protein